MSEEIALTDVVERYKHELSAAYERIVILECQVKKRDSEIRRLMKDE